MTLNRHITYQVFKYAVYVFLAMNVYWFFAEEFLAAKIQFPNGVPLGDIIEGYAATIDTFAWVILLLMFELETYVLEDRQFTRGVSRTLQGVRIVCYGFIVYAFYGYIVNVDFLYAVTPSPAITDLCALPVDVWSYAVDLDEYMFINAANCSALSSANQFFEFPNMAAVVDAPGLDAQLGLAWIDVVNAGVWLLVVLVLEIDVRLQERNRYEGIALHSSTVIKIILYGTLLYAAVYWGIKGDFVDFWDAFLWLVAFVFIELNVFEWRQESLEEAALQGDG